MSDFRATIVYRISKKVHTNDLSGMGAGLYGGRWNPKGINMVYTSGSIALATLEYLVHNFHLLSSADICLAKIEIKNPFPMLEYERNDLPEGWNRQMHNQPETQRIGKEFLLKNKDYILKVPSAVVPEEFNILLNPRHTNHAKTRVLEIIDPFAFDHRLLHLG